MLMFECKNMGIDCDYVATAETKIEVLAMAKTHALEIHSEFLKDLTAEQTNEKLEPLIHENAEESTLNNDEVMESDEEAEEGEKDNSEDEIEGDEDNKETETKIDAENEEVEIEGNEDNL
jgi:predicted small metal-binding protein